jgi:hypothetical protein
MKKLIPCPSCHRHRRTCEPTCPFCGAAIPGCEAAPATTPRGRMSRAMFIAGAAILGAAGACEKNVLPPYGTPPPLPAPDASVDSAAGGGAPPSSVAKGDGS